jgi:hypothetical protein
MTIIDVRVINNTKDEWIKEKVFEIIVYINIRYIIIRLIRCTLHY